MTQTKTLNRRDPPPSIRVRLAVFGLFGLISGCAQSPGLRDGVEGAFMRAAGTWDLNRDGIVTCAEWQAYARQLFKEADKNRDGKLTPEEFGILAKQDRLFETANFAYYDADRKGFVTEADFVDRPNPAFLALDKDRKCQLTTAEIRAETTPRYTQTNNPGIPGADGNGKK